MQNLYNWFKTETAFFQLRRKTAELTKACEKQFRLEQELAFHKIDAKFEPLPYAAFDDQVKHGSSLMNEGMDRWIDG